MYLQMPVRSDLPAYTFQVELEGTLFTFDFEWNERSQSWAMGIADAAGTKLLSGIRVITGWPLIDRFQSAALPLGSLYCIDTSDENKDPGADDFGSRVQLIYRESTTDDE